MHLPERTKRLEFKVKEGVFSYRVEYPNYRQHIQIESLKQRLTNDHYHSMNETRNAISDRVMTMIDCISHFTVLIPELEKDLNVSLLDLSPIDSMPILKCFSNQFWPWFLEWEKYLQAPEDDEGSHSDLEK